MREHFPWIFVKSFFLKPRAHFWYFPSQSKTNLKMTSMADDLLLLQRLFYPLRDKIKYDKSRSVGALWGEWYLDWKVIKLVCYSVSMNLKLQYGPLKTSNIIKNLRFTTRKDLMPKTFFQNTLANLSSFPRNLTGPKLWVWHLNHFWTNSKGKGFTFTGFNLIWSTLSPTL